MSIFKDVEDFFGDLFRGAAEKAWAHLHEDVQNHAITSANFSQVVKESIGVGYDVFVAKVDEQTGLTKEQTEGILTSLAKDLGIKETAYDKIYTSIQDKANTVLSDNGWKALFQDISKFVSVFLTSGKLDWVTLSLGVGQIAYEEFKKNK